MKSTPARWTAWLAIAIVIGVMVTWTVYLWKFGGFRPVFSAERTPRLSPRAMTIAPGVHLLGGLKPAAAYAVETSKGLVLVDSGLQSDASLLKSQLATLQLDWKRVRAVLLTHSHGDHCGGAEHLRAELGAQIFAGKGDAAVLRAGKPREAFFSIFFMPNDEPHPTTVDVELEGGETIDFGDVRFRALATPGHTPGSICYLMERAGLRALFGGDVISMLRGDPDSPSIELRPLGTYSAYLAPRYRGDARTFLTSLKQLRQLRVPDLVLPGHPGSEEEPQSPVLSQHDFDSLIDRGISDLTTVLARFDADGTDFLDGSPKKLLPDLYYLGDFRGAAIYGFSASSKFFLVDAPGGPGLKDFLRTRLEQLGLQPTAPAAILLTSCDPQATAGLPELLKDGHTRVIGASAGLKLLKALCPPGTIFVAAEDLPSLGWFAVKTIPLRGRGSPATAYVLSWAGKTVLFSGRIPIRVKDDTWADLTSEISKSKESAANYLISINRLADLKPDLWLPAVVSDGWNANLYDQEWQELIAGNYRAGHAALMSAR
jgi:glyoxylase-like metal-dependent hydrolase (beta-lactamase superfamily II)